LLRHADSFPAESSAQARLNTLFELASTKPGFSPAIGLTSKLMSGFSLNGGNLDRGEENLVSF